MAEVDGASRLESALSKLDFLQILDWLASECQFSAGAELAHLIRPSSDLALVQRRQAETAEAVDLLTNFPDSTLGGARDVRSIAERAAKGGRIQPSELLLVGDTLRASRQLRISIRRLPEPTVRFPLLFDRSMALVDLPDLEATISRAIGPAGEVLDTASSALSKMRKEVRVAHSRLMERLNRLVSGGALGAALQDSIITSRDGRYVVPVKADARSQVPGIVHDISASGQTIFVEPFDVVELNNTWRETQIEEQREIDRILDGLSSEIGDLATAISASVDALARVDLAMAKARLAFAMNASRPNIWESARSADAADAHMHHCVHLRSARHPLLDPKTVVPIDITVGERFRVLLITGPNTGGKTVALKTVGLLCLMAQTGLFIPAGDDSVVSIFPSIFVDIGDDQSIAQSLSTFSAHIKAIIEMLDSVDDSSLVLIDEVGAGTDPIEGSALARAIIGELVLLGPLVIATTHYSEVKAYAYETEGVENASVEFDVETLQPTYHVVTGVPGQSNALAIAQRLGLNESVLIRAASMISPEVTRADMLLGEIRSIRDQVQEERAAISQEKAETRRLRRRAEQALRDAELERQTARAEALSTAEEMLSEATEAVKRIQRASLRRDSAGPATSETSAELRKAESRIADFRRRVALERPAIQSGSFHPGDRVEVLSLGQEGEIIGIADDSADIQMGTLKVRQPLISLRRLGRARAVPPPKAIGAPAGNIPFEIDLRGHRVEESEAELEPFLDAAYRANLPFVRIIHGKGTGTLRTAVRRHLAAHPAIVRFEFGKASEGGDGVTLAYFKPD
jgi:DNA mismatch repair protein MutS2